MPNSDNKINIGNTQKGIDTIQINVGNVQKPVSEGYINVGNVQKQFWTSASLVTADRGVFAGGDSIIGNAIDYITINTLCDALSFGNLLIEHYYNTGAISNGLGNRGLQGGGDSDAHGNSISNIEYITINSASNATNFGNLSLARCSLGAVSNGTRGVFGGGYSTVAVANMDYITITTLGNANNFGNLTLARWGLGACSNGTRGIFGVDILPLMLQII